jgi:uncharacterized membrane protein
MNKTRMEAFSDGVIAVIITIMVLEMKAPHAATLEALKPLIPIFISYVLSFIFIGIYWNNHHHLLQSIQKVNGVILWANLHLLFWLSLIPFLTSWMGENNFAPWPVALYGIDLLGAAIAYDILTRTLIAYHGKESTLAKAHGYGLKETLSIILYGIAIPTALYQPIISYTLYSIVAAMWLVPDRRIEQCLDKDLNKKVYTIKK